MFQIVLSGMFLVGFFAGFRMNVFGLVVLCAYALAGTAIVLIAIGSSAAEGLLSALAVNLVLQIGYVGAVVVRAWLVPRAGDKKPAFSPVVERDDEQALPSRRSIIDARTNAPSQSR